MELNIDLIELYAHNEKELADEILCKELISIISKLTSKDMKEYMDNISFIPKEKIYILKFTFQIECNQ